MEFQTKVLERVSMNKRTTQQDFGNLIAGSTKLQLEEMKQVLLVLTKIAMASTKEDQQAELQTLRNVKAFLTQKLKQNEDTLKSIEKDMAMMNFELQKTLRAKVDIEGKYAQLESEREEYQENVKELNSRYKSIVKKMNFLKPRFWKKISRFRSLK